MVLSVVLSVALSVVLGVEEQFFELQGFLPLLRDVADFMDLDLEEVVILNVFRVFSFQPLDLLLEVSSLFFLSPDCL